MSLLADEQDKHLTRLRNEVITVKTVMADMADKTQQVPLYHENLTKMKPKKAEDHKPMENNDHVVASPPADYYKGLSPCFTYNNNNNNNNSINNNNNNETTTVTTTKDNRKNNGNTFPITR